VCCVSLRLREVMQHVGEYYDEVHNHAILNLELQICDSFWEVRNPHYLQSHVFSPAPHPPPPPTPPVIF
jgi:hypothetical protein